MVQNNVGLSPNTDIGVGTGRVASQLSNLPDIQTNSIRRLKASFLSSSFDYVAC